MKYIKMRTFNAAIVIIMVLYLIVRVVIWETSNTVNSAPSWVVLLDALFFLVPLAAVDVIWFICRKSKKN